MSYVNAELTNKVNQDTKAWHKAAQRNRNSMEKGTLVTVAEQAIQSGVYNRDFGHQAAGIISWYRETGDISAQQEVALSYFVVPFIQMDEMLSNTKSPLADLEAAIRDVQNGVTGRVQVTERTVVYATPTGVRVDIAARPLAVAEI